MEIPDLRNKSERWLHSFTKEPTKLDEIVERSCPFSIVNQNSG
jgi:hypothetical protein